nr:nucleotide sugar dehydrogenase [Solirubrobacterales bacterium]
MGVDVAIIGLGRIGLPLALSFADRGMRVIGVDRDPERLAAITAGRMPFEEPGAQAMLDRVRAAGTLELSALAADAARADDVVLTLGTPALSHIEIDIRDIRSALDDLLPHLHPGHAVVLRSTVAPGTTDFVAGYLAKHRDLTVGEDIFVAHVPERIAAGRFLEEIDTLPCIVGGVDAASGSRAARLFSTFAAPIRQTTPVQAELAKIWTNILRYATFALPNQLMMDCERHEANVFEVIDLINRDYPRGGIAQPGFTAGTCLRKDFAFSEERSYAPGMLLAVSRVNESVPLFLVEGMKRRLGSVRNRRVAVLGLAFKANTDDERDSLAHKLVRLLERELADVAVHDPRVATLTQTFEDAIRDAAAVVVAANHDEFRGAAPLRRIAELAGDDVLVVDPWDTFGAGQVFG